VTGTLDDMTADAAAPQGRRSADLRTQQIAAAVVTGGLIVLGAVLGLVWAAWSPARPPGARIPGGTVQINESEAFAAADGRFALITAVVGLAAGGLLWYRRSSRGPWVAAALGVGGLAGAWVMAQVGHLVGGGTNNGALYTRIDHLPLTLHMTGFFGVEGVLAVLVYSVLAAFAVDDDLGRPDPARDSARGVPAYQNQYFDRSVAPEYLVQYGGTDGDRAGLPQQGEFPTQDPPYSP